MSRTLTPTTNVESLKKEAKAWLRDLRSGDAAARTRLVSTLPDAPADPGLRDIQLAIARERGFPGWEALTQAIADQQLAARDRDELAEEVLASAKPWDSDKASGARIFGKRPDVALHSIHAAAMCGDLDEVRRRLARDPRAATAKSGRLDWEPLLYLAYGRLPGVETNALDIAELLFDHGADPAARFTDDWDNAFTLLNGVVGHGEQGRSEHPCAQQLATLFVTRGTDPFDTQVLYDTSVSGDDPRWLDFLWKRCESNGSTGRWRQANHGLGGPKGFATLDYLLGNAAGYNHLHRAEWLLAHGASPDTANAYSRRPVLLEAELAGFADMATLLRRFGAKPVTLRGGQAFVAAAMRADLAEAQRLAAADPKLLKDPSALIIASQRGLTQVAAMLLDMGMSVHVSPHIKGPLHWAAQNGRVEVARLLIAAGADVDEREPTQNGTPIGFAFFFGQHAMIDLLAPLTRDIFILARAARPDRIDALLREDPALAHARNPNGDTALHMLPDDEDKAVEVAELLLRHGADPLATNAKGETALESARLKGMSDVVAALAGE